MSEKTETARPFDRRLSECRWIAWARLFLLLAFCCVMLWSTHERARQTRELVAIYRSLTK
jgi:hypothetical protein